MDNKDNLTARDLELLEAQKALSSKEIAEMDDFAIKLSKDQMVDFNDVVDLYPDPDIPLDMQIPQDDGEKPTT